MSFTPTSIFGVILVLLGLLGFVSNPLVGTDALFAADAAHNIIDGLLGAILVVVSVRFPQRARQWLKVVGGILLFLGIAGLLTVPASGGMIFGIEYANWASNWFHLIAGVVIIGSAFL